MKKYASLVFLVLILLAFTACQQAQTVSTALGDFEYSQQVKGSIEDNQGVSVKASEGNVLLIVLLKPAKDTNVTMDQAQSYFTNGTQAVVDDQTYDLKCMDFEKSGGAILYGLVFDIKDNGYDSNGKQPTVSLRLPSSMPTPSPSPTATVAPSAASSATPIQTTAASPTNS